MIQKMGEHIHGWIAGVIVVIISVVFALWGISYFIGSTNPSATVVAKVNGTKLTAQALNQRYQNLISRMPSLAAASAAKQKQMKNLITHQWVHQTAIQTTLSDAGMIVGPDVIRNLVLSTPQFQQKGKFSSLLFQAFLLQQGLTETSFYQMQSQIWSQNQFKNAIRQSIVVTPAEVARYYQLLTQKRSFRYHIINSQDYLNQVHPIAQDLQHYYQTHQNAFRVPETVSINYISLAPASVQSQVHVTDAAVHAYYKTNIKQYTTGKKVKPFAQVEKSIRQQLTKTQVNQLIREKSDQLTHLAFSQPDGLSEVAKAAGLTLQHTKAFSRKGLPTGPASDPKVIAAAFGDIVLTQDMNSDPITLADGSVVYIHLRKHTAAHVLPFATVKQRVRTMYTQSAAQQLAVKQAHTLADKLNQSKPVNLSWHTYKNEALGNKHIPSAISTAVFNTPFAPNHAPVAIAVPMGDTQVAVAQVQQVMVNPTSKMSSKEQANLRASLINLRAKTLAKLTNASLYQHSRIKLHLNSIAGS